MIAGKIELTKGLKLKLNASAPPIREINSKERPKATPKKIFLPNVASLVDYFKDPTTYDGLESIAEIHPSLKSADIYPRMRSLTDDDLYAIAGHIMLQPKIVTEKWGGGKIYY